MELIIGHLLPFSMDQFMALNPDIIDGFESEGITLKPSELCCADKLIYLIKENTPLRFKCTLQSFKFEIMIIWPDIQPQDVNSDNDLYIKFYDADIVTVTHTPLYKAITDKNVFPTYTPYGYS